MRPARPPAALQITTDTPATVTSQPPTLSISNNVMENKKQKSKSEKCYLVESTEKTSLNMNNNLTIAWFIMRAD